MGFAYATSLVIYQIGSLFTGTYSLVGVICAFVVIALFMYLLFRKDGFSIIDLLFKKKELK